MNKVLKNSTIYTLGNIFPQAANYFLLPIYTSYLSTNDYGIVASMQLIVSILMILFTLAIDRGIPRLYFDYPVQEDKKAFIGTLIVSMAIISTVMAGIMLSFGNIISKLFKSIDFYPYFFFSILSAYFMSFSAIPKIYLRINDRAWSFFFISVAQFLLNAGLTLYFIIFKGNGAAGVVMSRMYANLILVPFFIIFSFKIMKINLKFRILKKSLSFSLPYLPSLLSAWVLNLSDRIFLERYFTLNEVGIYSLGYRIAQIVLLILTAMGAAYTPFFYRVANTTGDIQNAKQTLQKYNFVFQIIGLFVSFSIALISKDMLKLFADNNYFDAYKIVPIICFVYFINQGVTITNLTILQQKRSKQVMFILLFSAVINFGANALLIRYFKMYGAAGATLLSFLTMFIISYRYSMKCYFIQMRWKEIVTLLIPFSAIVVVFNYFLNLELLLSILLKIICIVLAGLLILLRNKNIIREILKK